MKGCSNEMTELAGRRNFLSNISNSISTVTVAGTVAAGLTFVPSAFLAQPALAAGAADDYVPKVEDVKLIAALGVSLDKLAERVGDANQWGEAGLNLAVFAKDPRFYENYARNYVSKSVKNDAESDPRVGKIKLAIKTIISVKDLIDVGTGTDAECKEAVQRVRKAQVLIGDFLQGSGVSDERVTKYIASHR